jgi:hypothetical protein
LGEKMKILIVFLVFWSGITALDVRCRDEGCYEVVKVFAELLERKIMETDAVSEQRKTFD